MPTYEYRCSGCDYGYETKESFEAPSSQSCPRCGALAKRVLYAPSVVFKGSGFYITDSRKDGASPASGTSDSSSNGSEPKAAETAAADTPD